MVAPNFDWGDYADTFRGDIWGITPHFFPGCKVLDIGANRGIFTAFCGVNGANVTAYEVHEDAYNSLLKTIRLNQLQVTAINKGVWTYTGMAAFDMTDPAAVHYTNSLITARTNRNYFTPLSSRYEVGRPVVSFEEVIGGDTWDIVKMDIEGAEYPILLECPESVFDHIKFFTLETHLSKPGEDVLLRERLLKHFEVDGHFGFFVHK